MIDMSPGGTRHSDERRPSAGARDVLHDGTPMALVNRPAEGPWYPGERFFSWFWLLGTFAVTGWILFSIIKPLVFREAWRYNATLATLGLLAFFLALYAFHIGIGALHWTSKYRRTKDEDWYARWDELRAENNVREHWNDVHHVVIVTTYKEETSNLKSVMYTLMAQKTHRSATERFCKRHITLVLAMEEREGEAAREQVAEVQSELGGNFCNVLATYHPPDRYNEIAGKASNYRFALEVVSQQIANHELKYLDGSVIDEHNIVVHVADGDSLYDPNHFPVVTYDYCTKLDRDYLVWQPCMLPTCNFWEIAPCVRQFGIMISSQEMLSATGWGEFQIPFSTYGLAFTTLKIIGGEGGAATAQDGDVIAEDHHMFIKGFFATSGQLRVQPIFLPCFNYTVAGCECLTRACCCSRRRCDPKPGCDSRFTQASRHMFALSELAYFCSLVTRGGCLCRRYRFGRRRHRVVFLFFKLLKIHSVAYVGLWVTLGAVLFISLKLIQISCDDWNTLPIVPIPHQQIDRPSVCDTDFSTVTFQIGAVLFSTFTTLGFAGTVCVHISFTRMLRATQDALASVADPNSIGTGLGDDDRDGSPRRRLVQVNRGGPWCGTVLQLVIEYALFGFVSSLYYGTVPSIIALLKLIRHGHRLKYVSASETLGAQPGAGARALRTPLRPPTNGGLNSVQART